MAKKKTRKYDGFKMRTSHINYRDTAIIIEKFNSSIASFKRFETGVNGGDDLLAAKKLISAGTQIYQCCEWALKNYLDTRYNDLEKEGVLSLGKREQYVTKLSMKTTTIIDLVEDFKEYSDPSYKAFGINADIISMKSGEVNNIAKHDAKIPEPSSYKMVVNEIRKIIINYLDKSAQLDLIEDTIFGEGNAWYELTEDTSDYSDMYTYILVANRLNEINFKGLFSIKWDMIIDFDQASDIDGLYANCKSLRKVNPWIKVLNRVEANKKITHSNLPYWIQANGILDDPDTIVPIEKWRNKTGKFLGPLLEKFHAAYTKPAKVFMVPVGNEKTVEKIVDAFVDTYDEDYIDMFMMSAENDYSNVDYDCFKTVGISVEDFCENLQIAFSSESFMQGLISYKIPAEGNKRYEIPEDFMAELRDSFEIVYEEIANSDERDATKTNRVEFYCGNSDISWYGVRENFDITRSEKSNIIEGINVDMGERVRLLRKVYYEPGVGGTTLMRRIAWELRSKYPTMILRNLNEQTARNVQKIYDNTHLPILIFADNNLIEIEEVKNLQSELKKMGFAFVICYFERKLRGQKASGAPYTVVKSLTTQECREMRTKLAEFTRKESTKDALDKIVEGGNMDERSPFIMSMYTFEEQFKGTKPYISYFLKDINNQGRKILFALALADFGNVSMDIEYFRALFDDASVEQFLVEEMPGISELLRVDIESGKRYIRIKYHLFAEEILKQLSKGYDAKEITFYNLLEDILVFIEDSKTNPYVINQDTLNILRSLFITRVADEDAEKPAFSPLITKLREETEAVRVGNYDDTKDAIIRIFRKLVKVYPEEPHFTAHLARYYFYIEKNFDNGFKYIDKAISLSEAMEEDNVDPLLYHMKAMGYASMINYKFIRRIYADKHDENMDEIPVLINEMEENAQKAFSLFKKVRETNVGIAGHVSEINLCIKIANLAKNLIDESEDFNAYIISSEGEWVMKYIDRAMDLLDECKGIATELDREDVRRLENELNQIVATLEYSIELWKKYIPEATGLHKSRARRLLARAIEQKNRTASTQEEQENLKEIVNLMQDNMEEDNSQPGNIRIWFDAIKRLKVEDQDLLLMDAVTKLNRWIALTDSVEAHYYRFIIKFIQALMGSSLAENELPKLLREMKEKSVNLYNRTSPNHWLTNTGEGIGALVVNTRNRRESIPEEEMANSLQKLSGRISTNYVNESHAYIRYKGIEVYFNPSATSGEIEKTKINQRVSFGVGFSYDGPRAYNKSIKLLAAGEFLEEREPLRYGRIVLCEVIKNVAHYTQVRIVGYDAIGSIHTNELKSPYGEDYRPKPGEVFSVKVLNEKFDNKRNQNTWMLTMSIDEASFSDEENSKEETTMSRAFKGIVIKE